MMREKHGYSKTPEYKAWQDMKARCSLSNLPSYKNYGGRGITVCAEWRKSFSAFLRDVGLRPSPRHSIDRINNSGNYEPGNVRWATWGEQLSNRRPSKSKTPGTSGKKLSPVDARAIRNRRANGEQGIALASEFGVTPQTVSNIFRNKIWNV